jgi:hypothetical protein
LTRRLFSPTLFGEGIFAVRELIGTYGKSAAFGAGGGFLLSFLVGLVSGNPFVVVLVRAFLFLILFAGLAAGAKAVIEKFLPEIASAAVPGGEEPRRTIDIVLPEENPHAESPGVRIAEADEETAADDQGEPEDVAEVEGDETGRPVSAEELPEGADGDAPAAGPSRSDAADAAPAEGREGGLPDLDQLGSAFSTGRPGRASPQGGGHADGGTGLGEEDPAALARMIRTVLKKDEKG